MPTHIRINVGKPSRSRDHEHHDDDLIAGWAKVREPKDEPHISSKTMALGQWLSRASANSGPKIAPGVGRKSS